MEVQFHAFDILVSDGENVRRLPLSIRKATRWR
jgi:ATP-dependent DNA ligase